MPRACKADKASTGRKQGVTGTGARGAAGMPKLAGCVNGLSVSLQPTELFFDSAFKLPEARRGSNAGEYVLHVYMSMWVVRTSLGLLTR